LPRAQSRAGSLFHRKPRGERTPATKVSPLWHTR